MATRRLWQVDAFASAPYRGNPCAVVFDAAGISDQRMQEIAAEMNLSETVFLLPPTTDEANYRARIFTPRSELPFAGHPTISAAFCVHQSLIEAGYGQSCDLLRQECKAGIIPVAIEVQDSRTVYTMTQVPPQFIDLDVPRAQMHAALGCEDVDLLEPVVEAASTGIPWMFARLKSPEAVAALAPDMTAITAISKKTGITGLAVYAIGATNAGVDVKLRAFAPAEGVPEDPVTGSANGCLAAILARNGALGAAPLAYVAEQGIEMGRDGRIFAAVADAASGPQIGGEVVRVMEGVLTV
ncbi:MAG: PhzF family phenazine biosynthesis protein [Minwuia sp.]|uniref:PhzF family phenazine biosynthesis protein n=1 Tax=Minwuia sp. TaxID=2493630 RepID=UPI003A86C52C